LISRDRRAGMENELNRATESCRMSPATLFRRAAT
jgi:hypothetical protein